MERAVAADADGEIHNVQLSTAHRAMNTQLFHVLVMCCGTVALGTLERADDAAGATGWRWLVKEHEPGPAGLHASLLLQILSCAFTDGMRNDFVPVNFVMLVHCGPTRGRPPSFSASQGDVLMDSRGVDRTARDGLPPMQVADDTMDAPPLPAQVQNVLSDVTEEAPVSIADELNFSLGAVRRGLSDVHPSSPSCSTSP